MSDLPWDQPELPIAEEVRPTFTRLDLGGPHQLKACGFRSEGAAEDYIRRNDLTPQAPRDEWTGQPIPVLMVEHRVGRGWCVLEFPRYQLSKVPF